MVSYRELAEKLPKLLQRKGLVHEQYGDLNQKQSVTLQCNGTPILSYNEKEPFYIHISVTGRCYARCKGCVNGSITLTCKDGRSNRPSIRDTIPERDAKAVINLLDKHAKKEAVLCFYGGEPLLAVQAIEEIVAYLEQNGDVRMPQLMLYTNGDLLEMVADKHSGLIAKLWLISVSIDGRKKQHDATRLGTSLDKIHKGLTKIRGHRQSTVLMWSTLREEQSLFDCFMEFLYLYKHGDADQFFWHWIETVEPYTQFFEYAASYETGLHSIMDHYLEFLQRGRILPVVHINELLLYILTGNERNSSACGVELAGNYDLIDGKVHSCADLPPELAIGEIGDDGTVYFHDHDLSPLVLYKELLGCSECGVHGYCGGRCPVQAQVGSAERLVQYCQLMRLHVAVVKQYVPQILPLMAEKDISVQQLYDESACFAQFTDVTP